MIKLKVFLSQNFPVIQAYEIVEQTAAKKKCSNNVYPNLDN